MYVSVLRPYLVLVALLGISAVAGDGIGGRLASLAVIALAAAKAAIVVAEYVEVRGTARWLVVVWSLWGAVTAIGLAILIVVP